MAKLNIKVENGATVVKVDGEVVTALKSLKVDCKGDNSGDDTMDLSFVGTVQGTNISRIVSAEGEVEMTIPDSLGNLLKGV